jgi:4-amino-4-deoxy-L-arabinose transferase-like glycosyltransferase
MMRVTEKILRDNRRHLSIWGASALLLLFFLQAALSSPLASPSFDEPYDLARGYAYARGTDLRMQQEHPVLVDGLGGLMLLLMPELTPPEQIPGWEEAHLFQFSQALLWQLGHDVDKIAFLARFPVIGLGLILGAVVYRWATDMYRRAGGLLALALCVLNPNIVAHARILSTDLGAACLATSTLYLWWRWARRPTAVRLVAATLLLGLALGAKTSNLLLIPLVGVLTAIRSVEQRWRWSRGVLAWGTMGAGALFVLWALYRFEIGPAPNLTGAIPVPAPSYWEAVAWVRYEMGLGRPAFLFGQHTIWGWWYYFPVVFVLKTPLPLLILLGLAVWLHATRRIAPLPPADYALWIFPPFYFGFSAFSTLNLGYRHILGTLPLMTVYAARVVAWPVLRSRWGRRGLFLLLGWLTVAALSIFPYHLAYFNELVGGPSNGYRYLVDSNLDWGQGLKHLRRYLNEQSIDEVWLGYFGTADPAYYLPQAGIRYRSLFAPSSSDPAEGFSPINPAPGWYAISATVLQGPFSPEPDLFDWFRRHEPVAKVGYSILVYRVEPDPDPPAWLGLCYTPEPVMDDAEVAHRFGRDDLRVVHFDCEQAWVYPAGDGPGWYLVPTSDASLPVSDAPLPVSGRDWGRGLQDAEVVYRERGLRAVQGYTVYRWRGEAAPEEIAPVQEAWSSPALAPTGADPVAPLSVPVDLGGEAAFLGYHLSSESVAPGGEVVLETVWEVTAQPADPPLSVFAHLVGPAGALSVGDGLGFPAIQWSTGDVFVQRSRLQVPPEASPGRYWMQVGLYSLATGARLPVMERGQPVSDRILLAPVEVER